MLRVFAASCSRRGAKGGNDRRVLEATHNFTVHNVIWRALPVWFGNWSSVWKRFWRLSRAGPFETTIGGPVLRLSGFCAPMVLDGPMTGPWFAAYVAQILVPTLRPGDMVILENLPPHKSVAVRELVGATGARLMRLPPYSPDFNPTENASAKLRARLRKTAARAKEALWQIEPIPKFGPPAVRVFRLRSGLDLPRTLDHGRAELPASLDLPRTLDHGRADFPAS